jgi:beta-N-acetylhexosaminidase
LNEARTPKRSSRTGSRRRIALVVLGATAIAAFALGGALGAQRSERRLSAAEQLSVPKLAGQRLIVGFPGTNVPAAVKEMIRQGRIAGVILFSDNFPSRAAGRRLIARLQHVPRPQGLRDALLVMTDQEGGLVKRIGGAPTASAAEMGARGTSFSREQGRRTARNLRNAGVNVDLAPVLDLARPGGVIAETHRGFGSTAGRVKNTGVAFANAMQKRGMAATAKHFPGLGAATENTDFAVQRIRLSKRTLRRLDEAPYERYIAIRGALVMLSTAIYPALSEKPAAFARPIATRELRVRLGFHGVSITDALGTAAVGAFGGPAKAGLSAAKAGTDLLLFTDYRAGARAYRSLRRKLRSGALDRARFERSVQRVLALRHRASRDLN